MFSTPFTFLKFNAGTPPAPGPPTANLVLWFKSDTNVTLTGANVTSWATTTVSPQVTSTTAGTGLQVGNALNGYNSVIRTANDQLDFNSTPSISSAYTHFVVFKQAGNYAEYLMRSSSGNFVGGALTPAFGGPGIYLFDGSNIPIGGVNLTTPQYDMWQSSSAGTVLRQNGSQVLTGGTQISLSPNALFGSGFTNNIEIWEVLSYSSVLSGGDIALVEAYLQTKYGFVSDPDAQAFLSATGITDPTISDAINNLVIDLKAASLWNKFYAIYPFVGGTSTTCKYNLVDPQDTDAAFRISFGGSWTFTSSGVQGGGSNNYANTYFQCTNNLASYYESSWGAYINSTGSNTGMVFAASSAAAVHQIQFTLTLPGISIMDAYSSSNRYISGDITPNQGLNWCDFRGANNAAVLYLNSTSLASTTISTMPAGSFNTYMFLGAKNQNDDLGDFQFSTNSRYGFAFIGDSIGAANASTLYTIIQTFNTTLGRQV